MHVWKARKGTERSLVTQALVRPQRTQHSCCLWWLCFDQLPSLHLGRPLNQKARPAGRGGLSGWCCLSNQGGQLATGCLLVGTASKHQYELRNRNMGPLKWEEENPWCIPVTPRTQVPEFILDAASIWIKPLLLHLKLNSMKNAFGLLWNYLLFVFLWLPFHQ